MSLKEITKLVGLLFLITSVLGVCKEGALTELEQLIIDRHNSYRARHLDTPPICYGVSGDDVEFKSQSWADHLTEPGVLFHHYPDPKPFGENMMFVSTPQKEPEAGPFYREAVRKWYKEIEYWDFETSEKNELGRNTPSSTTTHFTQVVWETTTQVHCGISFSVSEKTKMNRVFVVCQYFPKGNFIHQYATHVNQIDTSHVYDPSEDESQLGNNDPQRLSCEAGSYLVEETETCAWCPRGTYSAGGDIKCDPCQEGLVTPNEGAQSADQCTEEEPENIEFDIGTEEPPIEPTQYFQEFTPCSCWSRECRFCKEKECSIRQDLNNSTQGIAVRSEVKRVKYNEIWLYDSSGSRIGEFRFSKKAIHLTGCVACRTPRKLRSQCKGPTNWAVSMPGGNVRIKVGGRILYQHQMKGECLERYSHVARFSFHSLQGEESSYSFVPDEMEAGEGVGSGGCSLN